MPYQLVWEPRGLYRQYIGNVTVAERLASFNEVCADPRFDDLRYTITEYLAVEYYEITRESTEEMAAMHMVALGMNPRIRIAAVAVRRDVLDAIRDMKSHGFFEQPYVVFPVLEAARRWADTGGET